MPTDDSPLKPPENDQSQQTLDTRTPTPDISFAEGSSYKPPQPAAPRQSAFSPGDTIAKRFRILRFIAHGGMGEVYEALDIELKQKVALKTVRFGLLVDATALERFRQEIVVAKRVTHPNVCRTYDLFRHEATKEGESDVLVVSMELLAGQNLDQFLKEKGKLSTAEALPLVKQMVAGLAAAHEAGVVHRDFKTNNVMLVPPMSGSGPLRVVVSDFGLAHSLDVGEFALTRTGEMLGTPAFMAPEQVTGKEITPATDVYALGVVIFEMVTGRLPFAGKNWRETAFARLEQPPPSAKSLQPDLDSLWDLTILKCMQIAPADRYATVAEVEKALVGEIETVLPRPQKKLKRLLAAAIGLLLVAVLGILIGLRFPGLLQRGEARSVAVLGFKNNSGDRNLDRWGNEFRANLGGTLDVNPIHLVSHREMGNSWKLQSPSEMDDEPSSETLAQLQHHGCRYAVYGEYSVAGTSPNRDIRWNIHLVDTETGKGLGTIPVSLKETELTDVIPNTGEKVRGLLGVSLSEPEKLAVKNGLPGNDEASKAYAAGLLAVDKFDYAKAKDFFSAAVQADSTNGEIRSALAQAWWELGYETKAGQEAQAAAAQAGNLTYEKQQLIIARSLEYSGQWDRAVNLYASLWEVTHPKNYQFALRLAQSQIGAKNYQAAVTSLHELDASGVPPYLKGERDLLLADAQEKLGNNPERLKAADSAVAIAASLGGGLLQARAEIAQCLALLDSGKVDQAPKVCTDAVDLSEKQGDDLSTARAKNSVANGYFMHGDLGKAQPLYEQALTIATRIGDKRDQAGALLNLGNIQLQKNNPLQAKPWFDKSVRVSTERTGINDDFLLAKIGLALVAGSQGDPRSEITQLREVVQGANSVQDKARLSEALINLCGTQLQTADFAEARESCGQALKLSVDTSDKQGTAMSRKLLGDISLTAGDLPGAESLYQQALHAQQELGAYPDAPDTQNALAALYLERQDFPSAQKSAQAALDAYLAQKDAANEVGARCTLAQIYIEIKHNKDAADQIAKANDQLSALQDPASRATLRIQQAIVSNTLKPSASAMSDLKKVADEMTKAGFFQLALQAKFARAQALMGAAHKSEMKAVAEEAKQRGYLLLARKASAGA